jgi:hypothetical protein
MIKKICDKCQKSDSTVLSYTINPKVLGVHNTYDIFYTTDGIAIKRLEIREYCQTCHEELSAKINQFVKEALSL